MSTDNTIEVEFAATTDGIEAGADKASSAVGQAVAKMVDSVASLNESMAEMNEKVSKSIDGVKEKFEGMEKSFTKIQGFLAGGALFKEVIGETMAFTGEAVKLSRAFGMSTEEASTLNVALKLTGQTAEDFTGMAFKLERQIQANGAGIESMGVKTKDAHLNTLPLIDTMHSAADVLMNYKEGADRDAAAMYLFGRGAQDAMGILKLNSEVMARATVLADKYGLKVGPEGAANAKQYKMAMAEVHIMFEAIEEKIGDALLPLLTQLGGWFSEVGPSAVAVFGGAIKVILSAFTAFGALIAADIIAVMGFGAVVSDVVGAVVKMWHAMQHLSLAEFKAAFTEGMEHAKNDANVAFDSIVSTGSEAAKKIRDLWADPELGGKGDAPEKKGGNKQFVPPSTDGAEKSKLPQLKADLDAQLAANAEYHKDETEAEFAYWTQVKEAGKLGAKDKQEVQMILFNLTKKRLEDEAAIENEQLDAERAASKASIALRIEEVTAAQAAGKLTSSQALAEIATLHQQEITSEIDYIAQKKQLYDTSAKDLIKLQAEIDAARLKGQTEAVKDAAKAAAETQKVWVSAFTPITTEWTKSMNAVLAGTLKIGAAMKKMARDVALDYAEMAAKNIASEVMGQAEITAAHALGLEARTAADAEAALEAVAQSAWSALKQILNNAWTAMSGAMSATAAIPIVGPELAPGVGAATFGLVAAAAGSVASASGGYDIPAGVNPMTQLHEQEMVLPKAQANAVRDMASGGGSGDHYHFKGKPDSTLTLKQLAAGMKKANRNFHFSGA